MPMNKTTNFRFQDTRFLTFDNTDQLNDWLDEYPINRVVSWRLNDKHFNRLIVQYTRPGGFNPKIAQDPPKEAESDA